jgi:RNA polymerase sigma factor (sigma-70 family)
MTNLSELTDNQLVQAFRSGNNQALEILVSRYNEKIFSTILFLVKDKFLAEDLFQDAFIKIIDTIRNNRYTEEGKFLPWAVRIAHNLCIDHVRKVKRAPVVETGNNNDIFQLFNSNEEASDKKLMQEETQERVKLMLNLLPPEQREIVVLRHYADLSFKEIAEITNCSINTCLGRMRYGLINMRKLLTEKQVAL